jgi:hypothetical protein
LHETIEVIIFPPGIPVDRVIKPIKESLKNRMTDFPGQPHIESHSSPGAAETRKPASIGRLQSMVQH